ncbi:MAG: hypothetical protein H0U67_09215 [Gemmatimonadetes bacterium]|nr:hypothetical protein [Gemmatimonadota bacterium]
MLGACAPAMQGDAISPGPVAMDPSGPDPRVGLSAGWMDAGEAARHMRLVSNTPRPTGFFNPQNPGDFPFANSDLAFQGDRVFIGSFNGFQIYDVSNPASPSLVTTVQCPGGQGDLSVHGNLLFMSVEELSGRVDCGGQGVLLPVSPERFRGVRIFDISNIVQPRQVAAVQTCRGSHTHTLVPDANDPSHVYIYVSGAALPRPADELPGCLRSGGETGVESPFFRIEVIQVPIANPQQARVVNAPRLFADPQTGDIAGLWQGGRHGPGTQQTAATDHCHDITVYPAIGLGAGACSGNGILIDISNPASPVRIDEVVDPNFAYWHSATFNNAGTSVIYTDEWGGGTAARCRASDPPTWGANAIFTLSERRLQHAGYYKLSAPQTATENCVAHNGSLVPVPGRDIKVQAWYQGGVSVFDFTDPANPREIAFFDRGPLSATNLMLGGFWSAYWHNGYIYGSEIARGLDVLQLLPSEHLSQAEIDAAKLVRFQDYNPQTQQRFAWPAHPVVAHAYLDQLQRNGGLTAARLSAVRSELDRVERMTDANQRRSGLTQLATRLDADASGARDADRVRALASVVRELAGAAR